MNRRNLLGLAIGALAGRPATARAEPTPDPLRRVTTPCSLRRVCRELSRRFDASVLADGVLADLRVGWAFAPDVPLQTILERLVELTGRRVVRQRTGSGGARWVLQPLEQTTRLEAAWRREAVLRTIRELLRAADEHEQGDRELAAFSPGIRTYIRMGRGAEANAASRQGRGSRGARASSPNG